MDKVFENFNFLFAVYKFLLKNSIYQQILPGLFVGSIRDSRDKEQIKKNNITHILSIYEDPKESGVEVKLKLMLIYIKYIVNLYFLRI